MGIEMAAATISVGRAKHRSRLNELTNEGAKVRVMVRSARMKGERRLGRREPVALLPHSCSDEESRRADVGGRRRLDARLADAHYYVVRLRTYLDFDSNIVLVVYFGQIRTCLPP